MRTQLLAALKEADDYISGQELCEHFGVSRTAIWKAVKQLKEAGYVIEAVQNKGYKIVSTPDCLNTAELESIRKTSGQVVKFFILIQLIPQTQRQNSLRRKDIRLERWLLRKNRKQAAAAVEEDLNHRRVSGYL